jgi:hypothetical protein
VARAVLQIVGVVSLAGLFLCGLEAVPGAVLALPRGVSQAASLGEAERRLDMKLTPPAGWSGSVRWPPQEIRYTVRPVRAVSLRMEPREDAVNLTLYRSQGNFIPDRLRPPGRVFHSLEVWVKSRPALLTTLTLADNQVWQDLEWTEGAGRTAMRFQGPTVQLLGLAQALRESEP